MASKVKVALGVGGGLLGVAVASVGGIWWWLGHASQVYMDKQFETHTVDFPVPFPLSPEEIEALRLEKLAAMSGPVAADPAAPVDPAGGTVLAGTDVDPLAGVDLDAIALERAIERGKHYVEARYVCVECHGRDFGGGTMIDDPGIGTLLGKNITLGAGSVTLDYGPANWDRIVRHGVRHDGRVAVMPSGDFIRMSDHELSDIIAYVRSMPPVDKTVPEPTLGPIGKMLIATGQLPLSAYKVPDHHAPHVVEPPPAEPTVEFGQHLAGVCTGCHTTDFAGGKMKEGDPSWPPVGNITPHPEGIGTWTYEGFATFLRSGVKPDGSTAVLPMAMIIPYTTNMTDVETAALWAYLQTVAPLPDRP